MNITHFGNSESAENNSKEIYGVKNFVWTWSDYGKTSLYSQGDHVNKCCTCPCHAFSILHCLVPGT